MSQAVPHEPPSIDATLHHLLQELPDACERLAYVEQMTEQAANKVLGLVEAAQEEAGHVFRQGADLSESLMRLSQAQDLSVERARAMMRLCAAYAAKASDFARRTGGLHTELVLAQEFQDLSGQVINKVIAMLTRSEQPLRELLGNEPAPAAAAPSAQGLEGVQTPDKALKQDDVDALLAEMGF
ncbi:protein phosphatase CheZ [Pelomonas sp. CA6]|uniref:protein phosphatase CheZ n=1 Tax=Pelomonas sp. CA6 TaxID=2907999 RepID=UPI001F4C41BE|nr:protein phosphatase CheZ [Pelomonas sp. CA6]MCH7343228.1 protein phosphatase CheZ [Pelomonas sp. CA6]